jgi:hypothetical protein
VPGPGSVSELSAGWVTVGGVRRIAYAQQLQGRLTAVGPGLVDVELATERESPLGAGATLASQLAFASRRAFCAEGTIALGGEPALCFRTVGHGVLAPSPEAGVRHGTAMLEAWGIGPLSGARGRITSNFVVTGDGALTDDQVVVLFIEEQGEWLQ